MCLNLLVFIQTNEDSLGGFLHDQGYISSDYYKWWGFEDYHLYEMAKDEITELAQKISRSILRCSLQILIIQADMSVINVWIYMLIRQLTLQSVQIVWQENLLRGVKNRHRKFTLQFPDAASAHDYDENNPDETKYSLLLKSITITE